MRVATVLAVAMLGMTSLMAAEHVQATIQNYQLNIPRQSLDSALKDLAQQTGLQIGRFSGRIDGGAMVGPVQGEQTAERALQSLLRDTGLDYKIVGDTTIAVYNPKSTDVSELLKNSRKQETSNSREGSQSTSPGEGLRLTQVEQSSANSASTSNAPRSSFSESDSPTALQEVVVSAERIEESINKVPISMTALSQDALNELHLQTLNDIATVVPGLYLAAGGAGSQAATQIIIRGVSTGNNAPTAGVYVDETPIIVRQMTAVGFSGTPQPDLFDLDRLEVLRGPQGTLFGASAMGGAIRYVTPQPSLRTSSGYTRADISNTSGGAPSYDVGVAYGAPITEGTSGFRVSGWYRQTGGFIDIEDPFTGQLLNRNANASHTLAFRPAFTVAPMDGLAITPAAFIQRIDSDEPNEYWGTDLPVQGPDAFTTGFGAHVHQPLHTSLTVSSIAIKYGLSGMTFNSDTSYTDISSVDYDDYSVIIPNLFGYQGVEPALSSFYSYDENIAYTHAWQQEFRLSSDEPDSRLTWATGLYYRRALDRLNQYVTPDLTPVEGPNPIPDYVQNGVQYNSYGITMALTEQKAVFADVTAKLVGGFKASVGLRYEHESLTDQNQIFAGPLDGTTYSATKLPDDVEHPVTPKYSLTYQITDEDMVYATVAKGYRLGGSNSLAAIENTQCTPYANELGFKTLPTNFKSDSLWSYEIGTKDSYLHQRLSVQASAYYIDWKGIQSTLSLNCGQNFTTNIGEAIIQGFDFQMAAIVVDGLKVSANAGYTDAYYPNATFGAAPSAGAPRPVIYSAGQKLAVVNPWSASGVVDYSFSTDPIWQHSRSYMRVDYRWLSSNPPPNPLAGNYNSLVPWGNGSYGMLNLRYGVIHEQLDLSLYVSNLTNDNPRLGYTTQTAAPASTTGSPPMYFGNAVPPRTYGITALYKF